MDAIASVRKQLGAQMVWDRQEGRTDYWLVRPEEISSADQFEK